MRQMPQAEIDAALYDYHAWMFLLTVSAFICIVFIGLFARGVQKSMQPLPATNAQASNREVTAKAVYIHCQQHDAKMIAELMSLGESEVNELIVEGKRLL